MVGHEHKGINDYLISLLDLSKDFTKFISILIIEKDIFSAVSTVHYVVKRAFIFYSCGSGHEEIISLVLILSTDEM